VRDGVLHLGSVDGLFGIGIGIGIGIVD